MDHIDNQLRELFSDFNPGLSSSSRFLDRLERNMEAIEAIKAEAKALRRHYRLAVMVAALTGFITGVGLTLLLPLLGDIIMPIRLSLPEIGAVMIDMQVITWIVTAIVALTMAFNAYEFTLSRLAARESARR